MINEDTAPKRYGVDYRLDDPVTYPLEAAAEVLGFGPGGLLSVTGWTARLAAEAVPGEAVIAHVPGDPDEARRRIVRRLRTLEDRGDHD